MSIIVLKLGSSVLPSEDALADAVHAIYHHVRSGRSVVAVVSAIGDTTDTLLRRARAVSSEPNAAAVAALLATGEAQAVALLTLALDRAGIPAVALDVAAVGIRTQGPALDATPTHADTSTLTTVLAGGSVAVVPGFVGRSTTDEITLLGRGGSDLTALFLAAELGADCILLKDVDGLYEWDPASPGPAPRRYGAISFEDALALDGRIVQHKAIRLARARGQTFQVTAPSCPWGTVVGTPTTTPIEDPTSPAPLRVSLLGLGTVGLGVYRRLAARPRHFRVVGVAVRDLDKHVSEGVPQHLLTTDASALIDGDCDVVVELLGGIAPAAGLVLAALASGRHVVTANKAVIAGFRGALAEAARVGGGTLLYSASVGGAVPALEAVRRATRVTSVEGVLNGTCNFVLDEVARGTTLPEAVVLAQRAGFAEADPTLDLDGTDAAHKLTILARHAFGVELEPGQIEQTGIDHVDEDVIRSAADRGGVVRLVARCKRDESGIHAVVRPVELPATHPLARATREQNCVLIETDAGIQRVHGKGAGRWPTTESVVADLDHLHRASRGGAL
jgi:homoserine dehydrogenase